MRKIILVLLLLLCCVTTAYAEDATPAAVANDGKPLITSLPKRKATNSLKNRRRFVQARSGNYFRDYQFHQGDLGKTEIPGYGGTEWYFQEKLAGRSG